MVRVYKPRRWWGDSTVTAMTSLLPFLSLFDSLIYVASGTTEKAWCNFLISCCSFSTKLALPSSCRWWAFVWATIYSSINTFSVWNFVLVMGTTSVSCLIGLIFKFVSLLMLLFDEPESGSLRISGSCYYFTSNSKIEERVKEVSLCASFYLIFAISSSYCCQLVSYSRIYTDKS